MFLGTAVGCVALIISSIFGWDKPGAALTLAGGVLYLVGTLLVTMICNVPRNDALAGLDPVGAESGPVLDRLCTRLDGVEPRTNHHGSCRFGPAHGRALVFVYSRDGLRSRQGESSRAIRQLR